MRLMRTMNAGGIAAGLCPHGLGKRTKRTGGSNAAYSQERAHPVVTMAGGQLTIIVSAR